MAEVRLCFLLVELSLRKISDEAFFAIEHFHTVVMLTCCMSSLFIFDYHLPDMNGMEYHDLLHAREALTTILTSMLSNSGHRQHQKERL